MEYCWKILVLLLAVIIYAPLVSTTDSTAVVTQPSSSSTETPSVGLSGALQRKNSSDDNVTASEGTSTSAGIITQQSTSSQGTSSTQETSSTEETSSTSQPTSFQNHTGSQETTGTQETTSTQVTSSTQQPTTTPKPTTTPETAATGTTGETNSSTTVITTSASTADSSNISATTLPTSTSSSTAADSVSSVTTTLAPPSPLSGVVVISETNLLLSNDSSRYFVEIQVTEDVNLTSIWLVIDNAGVNTTEQLLLNYNMVINSSSSFYVYTSDTVFNDTLQDIESVLIALYADEDSANRLATEGLLDILLYSTSGSIDPGLTEKFSKIMNQNLVIDYKKLNITVPVSLSRCSRNGTANNVAVLTPESRLFSNACELKEKSPLEMKLTQKIQPCSLNPPSNFKNTLVNYVISNLNKREQCGLAASMLAGMDVKSKCSGDNKELDVSFTVISAFPSQVALIKNGYIDLLRQPKLKIESEEYNVSSCYENCFNGTITPTSGDDDRMRVTIAVVVSCIGVFLLVLLFVVLYLRRKRKGILQFHMTRLDEDDDLAGDMDDFVGNQGPTFRSYR